MSTFRAKELVKDNLRIPTLPQVVLRINERLDDPATGLADVGQIIAEDAPLTTVDYMETLVGATAPRETREIRGCDDVVPSGGGRR